MKIIITEDQEELLKNKVNNLIGKKVMCYYDLHRHTFSVTHKGLLMLKADYLKLNDVNIRNKSIVTDNNNKIIVNICYKGYYNNYLDKDHYGKLFHNNEIYYKNIIKINMYMTVFVYPNNDDI